MSALALFAVGLVAIIVTGLTAVAISDALER